MIQVSIIGLGTIGGSLGMALQQAISAEKGHRAEISIAGYDPDGRVVEEALVRGAINEIARNLPQAVQQADLVVIAQPVPAVGETLQAIGPLLQEGCIVTDTASSKAAVLRLAEQHLPATVSFVGGHPIPLPQQEVNWEAGIKGAKPDLLRGAVYCLVPGADASEQAVNTIRNLAEVVGASPFFVDALEHDALLAGLTQAPYIVAAAMLATIAESSSWRDLKLLADPTYRQLNQVVAARPADFWQSCLANRDVLASWLDRVLTALWEVRQELGERDSQGEYLKGLAGKSRQAYQDWTRQRDERRRELDATGGMQHVQGAKESFLRLIVPGAARRRPRPREDR
jgi:prephenate dehydrogenase